MSDEDAGNEDAGKEDNEGDSATGRGNYLMGAAYGFISNWIIYELYYVLGLFLLYFMYFFYWYCFLEGVIRKMWRSKDQTIVCFYHFTPSLTIDSQ